MTGRSGALSERHIQKAPQAGQGRVVILQPQLDARTALRRIVLRAAAQPDVDLMGISGIDDLIHELQQDDPELLVGGGL